MYGPQICLTCSKLTVSTLQAQQRDTCDACSCEGGPTLPSGLRIECHECDQSVPVEAVATCTSHGCCRQLDTTLRHGAPSPVRNTVERLEDYPAPHYDPLYPGGPSMVQIAEHLPFNLGSAFKYIWRLAKKPGADPSEDLQKAAWFIERERQRRERSRPEIRPEPHELHRG